MMNKQLIALLMAIVTVGSISALCDEYGCDDVIENTGYAAGEAAATTVDVGVGAVAPIFGGRGVSERIDDRRGGRVVAKPLVGRRRSTTTVRRVARRGRRN